MDNRNAESWYSFDRIRAAVPIPARTLRRRLAAAPANAIRSTAGTQGRPQTEYHFSALPELASHYQSRARSSSSPAATAPAPAADDLATAQLRLTAVTEFRDRIQLMSRQRAATLTCRTWATAPRSLTVTIRSRLPGGHSRHRRKTISLGKFSPATLRSWDASASSLYKGADPAASQAALKALIPHRKTRCGRTRTIISDNLLNAIWAVSGSTARADITKAVAHVRAYWREPWPNVSLKTWQRRVRQLDPRNAGKDLNHSISLYRQHHSPDAETDWTKLAYNARWDIDDVQKDWYAHSSDLLRIIRPYAYAILRASTRQWIALITTETDIIQEQIRTLVGCAMTSKHGGIPVAIKFERGRTASDPHLEWLLNILGVIVSRTSMDSGHVYPGAAQDRATGHFQGKPLVESNFRRAHNIEWNMPLQIGPRERDTAPARTETLKRMAQQLAADGKQLIIPTAQEVHAISRRTCLTHNSTPHSGLPRIVDPETGATRHMTPDEKARSIFPTEISIMDPQFLPLFYARGERVRVTRNGFRIRNLSYGRYDQDVLALPAVTAYVNSNAPEQAYVHEIGRYVELYVKQEPGETAQIARKRTIEKRFRNKHDAAVAAAIEIQHDGPLMVDAVQIVPGPEIERPCRTVSPPDLVSRATSMRNAATTFRRQRADQDSRFDLDDNHSPSQTNTGHGILARARDIQDHVAVLTAPQPEEEDQWKL